MFKPVLAKRRILGLSESPVASNVVAGIAAGSSTVMFMNPLWLIKVRMQLQEDPGLSGQKPKYASAVSAFRIILKEDGVRGLFRGLLPALLLTTNGAIQLAAYEELKRINLDYRQSESNTGDHLLMGATSKVIATLITYPFQVTKTRMQRERTPGHEGYQRTLSSIKRISKFEGLRGFYKGLTANLVRVVPSSALIFAVYEETKYRLNMVL